MAHPHRFSIIGGGGFGLEVAGYLGDIHATNDIRLSLWDDTAPQGPIENPNLKYKGRVSDIQVHKDETVLICIGNCQVRAKIARILQDKAVALGRFIHPTACVSSHAVLNAGCLILPFSCISFAAIIGENVAINSHVGIGHHARIGDHCVVSPHCLIAGGAELGAESFMGASSTITPGKTIGKGSQITAGSVAYRKAADHAFLSGNPAKNFKKG